MITVIVEKNKESKSSILHSHMKKTDSGTSQFGFIHSVTGIIFCIFLIIWVAISVFVFSILRFTQDQMTKTIRDSQTERVSYYAELVYSDINRITGLLKDMCIDDEVSAFLFSRDDSFDYQDYVAYLKSYTKLQSYRNTSMYIEDAFLVIPQSGELLRANLGVVSIPEEYREKLKECETKKEVFFSYENTMVFLSRGSTGAIVGIEISTGWIRTTLNELNPGYFDCFLIEESEGTLLGRNQTSTKGREVFDALKVSGSFRSERAVVNDNTYICVLVDAPEKQYAICVFAEELSFFRELNAVKTLWIPVTCFFLLLPFVFGLAIRCMLFSPMKQLLSGMKAVENEEWTYRLPRKSTADFRYVFEQYNNMISHIEMLIGEVYEKQLQMERIRRMQLQSQINPHFLYNSFYIGYRMAKSNDTENVAKLCMYLGDYFKILTYASSGEITVSQEIHFIDTYLKINELRFGDRLEYSITQDNIAEEDRIMPLLLQPLVENAIRHGAEKTTGSCQIRISVTKQERKQKKVMPSGESSAGKLYSRELSSGESSSGENLLIVVEDDIEISKNTSIEELMQVISRDEMPGSDPQTPEETEMVRQRTAAGRPAKGFGLWNVQKRLLSVGSDGLHFEIPDEGGFRVWFCIPAKQTAIEEL